MPAISKYIFLYLKRKKIYAYPQLASSLKEQLIHKELKDHSASSLKDLPVPAKAESSSANDKEQEISLVLLVLSALSHQERRDRMRAEVVKTRVGRSGEVKLV